MTKKKIWPLLLVAMAVVAVSLIVSTSMMSDGDWKDGQTHGRWHTAYTGHGTVGGKDDSVHVEPQTATSADQTHASMVVSTDAYAAGSLSARVRTTKQLRQGNPPNSWEVGWLVWHYTDDAHFYYFVPKPNGWELGKRDPAYPGGQRFLASGDLPTFPPGADHDVTVHFDGPTMTVLSGNQVITKFTDTERPYDRGSVGLYSEDAAVTFERVEIDKVR